MSEEFLSLAVMELGPEETNALEHWERLMNSDGEIELKCYVLSPGPSGTPGVSLVCCKIAETSDKILIGFPCSRGLRISGSKAQSEVIPFCRPPLIWLWKSKIEWEHVPYAETEHYYCQFLLEYANYYIPEFITPLSQEFLTERLEISGFIIKDNPIETLDALKAIGKSDLLTEEEEEPTLH